MRIVSEPGGQGKTFPGLCARAAGRAGGWRRSGEGIRRLQQTGGATRTPHGAAPPRPAGRGGERGAADRRRVHALQGWRRRGWGAWAGADPFDQLRAGRRPRCVKIFAMTSGCSMKAMRRIGPPQRGVRRELSRVADQRIRLVDLLDEASTSSAERRAQARSAAEAPTSLPSRMRGESSPCACRRFPRFTLLYQP